MIIEIREYFLKPAIMIRHKDLSIFKIVNKNLCTDVGDFEIPYNYLPIKPAGNVYSLHHNERKAFIPFQINEKMLNAHHESQGTWKIKLNNKIKDPITGISFKHVVQKALWDTGSDVNAMTRSVFDQLEAEGISPDKVYSHDGVLRGPSGENIVCKTIAKFTFLIATTAYREIFHILEATGESIILGYSFMSRNGISLTCGQYITNHVGPTTEINDMEEDKKERICKILEAKNSKDTTVEDRAIGWLHLQIVADGGNFRDYSCQQFIVKNCCVTSCGECGDKMGELCTADQQGSIMYPFRNKLHIGFTVEEGETFFCIPLMALHQPSVFKTEGSIRYICPKDILYPITDIVDIKDTGFSAEGYEYPDIEVKHDDKTFKTMGEGIPMDLFIDANPCEACRIAGHETCRFNEGCTLKKEMICKINAETTRISEGCLFQIFDRNPHMCLFHCNSNNQGGTSPLSDHCVFIEHKDEKWEVIIPHKIESKEWTKTFMKLAKKWKRLKVNFLVKCEKCFPLEVMSELFNRFGRTLIYVGKRQDGSACCRFAESGHSLDQQIRQYIAADRMFDECELMTEDPEIVKELQDIIKNRGNIFSKFQWDIGRCQDPATGQPVIFHYRLRKEAQPFVCRFIPIAPQKKAAAEEIITNLLKHGILSKAVTPWATHAVWAEKVPRNLTKSEMEEMGLPFVPNTINPNAPRSLRLAVNFKTLNSYLQYPIYPLEGAKSVVSNLRGSECVSLIDLTMSYYSLSLSRQSALYTGFTSGISAHGILIFNRSPMGIHASSSILSSALQNCLQPIRKNSLHYSDNIILHSAKSDHTKVIDTCFKILEENGFRLKKGKTILYCQGKIKVLGLIVDTKEQKVYADPSKVEAIKNMKYPGSVGDMLSFLGAVNFLIEFIPSIQDQIAILYKTTRKSNNKFHFGETEKQAFDEIVATMVKPENFVYFPDYDKPFHLKVDSSTISVGFCLMQEREGRLVSLGFHYRVFSPTQSKYHASEREVLGLALALKKLEGQIRGSYCTVWTDCRALVCLTKHASTNSKIARYMSFIQTFSPPLKFLWNKADTNEFKITDLLSRPGYVIKNPVVNKSIKEADEKFMSARAEKLSSSEATSESFPILMDYVLNIPDEELEHIPNNSIYIDEDNNVVMKDKAGGLSILKRSDKRSNIMLADNNYCSINVIRDFYMDQAKIIKPGYTNEDADNEKDAVTSTETLDTGEGAWYDDEAFEIRKLTDPVYDFKVDQEVTLKEMDKGINDDLVQSLDLSSLKERFLQFIVLKFPFLNLTRLADLQRNDPNFGNVYESCKNGRFLEKENVYFELVRQLLIRVCVGDNNVTTFQLGIPKYCVMEILMFLHKSLFSAHIGTGRMAKEYSRNFYTPNIMFFCSLVCSNCQICMRCKPSKARRGDYLHKLKLKISKPAVLWYSDAVKLCNDRHAEYTHLIVWVCAVTNFIVVRPYKHTITGEEYVKLFESAILQYFNETKYLVTDNARDICNTTTKQYLSTLNILLVTTSPHSHKSNKTEILNRHLIQILKVNMSESMLDPKMWHLLITQSVIALNNTPFERKRYNRTPYQLMFGHPSEDRMIMCNPSLLENEGYSSFVVQTAKAAYLNGLVLTSMQLERIKETSKTQKIDCNEIVPGDLVYKVDDQLNLEGVSKKLRPRFNKLYYVLAVSNTSCFIKLYKDKGEERQSVNTFREFLENPKTPDNKILKTFRFEKADKSKLKKIKGIVLCNRETKALYEDSKHPYPELPVEVEVVEGQLPAIINEIVDEEEIVKGINTVKRDTVEKRVRFYGYVHNSDGYCSLVKSE